MRTKISITLPEGLTVDDFIEMDKINREYLTRAIGESVLWQASNDNTYKDEEVEDFCYISVELWDRDFFNHNDEGYVNDSTFKDGEVFITRGMNDANEGYVKTKYIVFCRETGSWNATAQVVLHEDGHIEHWM